MITQWDIISNLSPRDNSIYYALLIDGTEHDARLIAKKLQGYAQPPQPALAPFVYRFALPADLDENTLEKIRVAVREGIEQAKKVNEFIPGGSLGDPLFNADVVKEDKDFPTFITLDPSESFFRDVREHNPLPPPGSQQNDVQDFEFQQVNIPSAEEDFAPAPKPLPPAKPATPKPPVAPVGPTASQQPPLPPPAPQQTDLPVPQEPVVEEIQDAAQEADILTSVEADEPWSDEPPFSAAETPAAVAETQQTAENIDLQTPAEQPKNEAETMQAAYAETPEMDLPLTDKDMLNKDMEGTLLDQSLEDIFSAETKYDMFLDLEQLSPSAQTADAPQAVQQVQAQVQSQIVSAEEQDGAELAQAQEEVAGFNIFDQKIKDQTCFMDLDDVKTVTERITQKDLGFVQHAQVKTEPPLAEETSTPALQAAATPQAPSFSRLEENNPSEEVLDPFEQMLAASSKKEEPQAEPLPENPPQPEPVDILPPVQEKETEEKEPSFEKTPSDGLPEETPQAAPQPEQPAETIEEMEQTPQAPVPPAPITEKPMTEKQGDKKPIFHIKRKVQEPIVPATPQPPQAPAAPQAPAPVTPPVPAPTPAPAQQVQKAAPVSQFPPQPQEEKLRTILRRRRPNTTFLEKTRTIDHSIEMPISELKKHNWPLEVPLIPTYTLENMTISVNRFAHATAISVIDNPGKLYNPLVMHGTSGTGKTHFLHAIGYALSKKYGQENIFITNGVRLSRGIQRYMMEGNIDKFEEFVSSVKALLIDDIHLISVNEQNRPYLSKLLNDFLAQKKQIVITSKYPPENLEKLEELLNFKLDSGWISELKPASGPARTRIIQKMLLSSNLSITDQEVQNFFGHPNMSLGTVARSIRRVRVLEKLIFPSEAVEQRSTSAVFEQLLATSGEDRNSEVAKKIPEDIASATVEGAGEWGRIGFFYPQNQSHMMNWLVFALQQRAKELGISGGPELAVRSSYSTENIISSAFKIANLCDNKKLKGAVILGPSTDNCDPSVRENFYDILTHMLEIMLIRCGVINFEDANAPSTYVKILSELLR